MNIIAQFFYKESGFELFEVFSSFCEISFFSPPFFAKSKFRLFIHQICDIISILNVRGALCNTQFCSPKTMKISLAL